MVSSRPPKTIGLNKCLIGYSLYFVLATVNFIMERIIQQLKEQREKAKDTFIENSFIKRKTDLITWQSRYRTFGISGSKTAIEFLVYNLLLDRYILEKTLVFRTVC